MGREIDERVLARIWKGQWLEASKLRTAEGQRLQVVFPGRANGDRGPDFLGAIIALGDARLMEGDVELHVEARDWEAHGHHGDPAYNGVVLHVVWTGQLPWVEREDGGRVATLPLKGSVSLPIGALLSLEDPEPPFYDNCREAVRGLEPQGLGVILDRMGDARFQAKGAFYQGELSCYPPQEVLYQGLMRALGYSKNQDPFRKLAVHLPFSTLEGLAVGLSSPRRRTALAAALLGVAGLLPSRGCGDLKGSDWAEAGVVEGSWRKSALHQEMKAEEWHTFRIRPANHPRNRIVGAAHLLERFVGQGLLGVLMEDLLQAHSCGGPGLLERRLEVPRYLGRGRAREMVVNVLLPLFWALGELRSRDALSKVSLDLFRAYPKGQGNRITRQMELQLLQQGEGGVVDSARRQQGLIHLFKGPCRHGYCADCPVGRALAVREREATPAS